jgi:hypothetical protein
LSTFDMPPAPSSPRPVSPSPSAPPFPVHVLPLSQAAKSPSVQSFCHRRLDCNTRRSRS